MKFVGLISGGKDSFFNIHHCLSRGHELAALGNLYPSQQGQDEIDSFMFQTVGHDVIDYYRECLDVPLFRQVIKGTSSNQDLEYSITEDDEIEDLYLLLKKIKDEHPEIEGVSCGAILSNYQRTRVENVCGRLGLTSLTFLWQRNQLELMQEMCASGMDARIIKVAAIGLTIQHLGKSLNDVFPQLTKLNSMYDVHICGEGGEFETIVLDTPYFKKKRLEIIDQEVVENSNDGVSYLKLKVQLVDKTNQDIPILEEPNLIDEEFQDIHSELQLLKNDIISTRIESSDLISEVDILRSVVSTTTKLYVSNLASSKYSTIELQMAEVFETLVKILEENNLTVNDIQHITLLLSNMREFGIVNEIYSKNFESLFLPPSRVCIETELNSSNLVQLSCVALKSQNIKRGIHVRSRSYWAPQNIGPYSQSIVENTANYKLATLSGQIPLVPSSMQLSVQDDSFNSVLSLQHLIKVKSLVNVNNIGNVVCFITDEQSLAIVCNTWQLYTEHLGDNNLLANMIVVQVDYLPKKASIEWSGLAYEDIIDMYEDFDDENDHEPLEDSRLSFINSFEFYNILRIGKGFFTIVSLFTDKIELIEELIKLNGNKEYLQVFTTKNNINKLLSNGYGNADFLSVKRNFNYVGNQFNYSIIWKIETT